MQLIDAEIWKDVPNYEGQYQVSNFGNVRSLNKIVRSKNQFKEYTKLRPGKMLTQGNTGGYKMVYLNGKGMLVHRLVAMTFIPNPENKPEVNHKDRNHSNNHLNNLEWVTKRENTDHALNNRWDPGASRRGKTNSPEWYEKIKHAKHIITDDLINYLRNSHKNQSKPCRCIELNKDFISLAEAGRYINSDPTTISDSIKFHRKVKSKYTFEFIDKGVD